jgi:hypothetical protein
MTVQQTIHESHQFSHEKLLAFVRAVAHQTSGREDDDHPLPPSPWDPVIRMAPLGLHPEPWLPSFELARVILVFFVSLRPEISDAVKPHSVVETVGLNPQPLPPRQAFLSSLARIVIDRAELIAEIANSMANQGEYQAIIIVSGYLARFVGDFCATGFRPRWPFPNPPPSWFVKELDGVDLLLVAAQLDQAANEVFSPALGESLTNASAEFAKTSLLRMQ